MLLSRSVADVSTDASTEPGKHGSGRSKEAYSTRVVEVGWADDLLAALLTALLQALSRLIRCDLQCALQCDPTFVIGTSRR